MPAELKNVLPKFRLPQDAIEKDIEFIRSMESDLFLEWIQIFQQKN